MPNTIRYIIFAALALLGVVAATACDRPHTPGQVTGPEVVEFFADHDKPISEEVAAEVAQWLNDQYVLQQALLYVGNIEKTKAEWAAASGHAGGVWKRLRICESNNNYKINTGNGYYGAYQFSPTTWWGVGGSGYPHNASPAEQDKRAQILQARSGWGQWPACSRKLGLR